MPDLHDAIELAVHAHRGQRDKNGQPYILHVLRVMFRMRSEEAMIAAALHDAVEDSPLTLDDLRAQGYPEPIVAAVDRLTRREGEGYGAFVARIKPDPLAVTVKLGDLEDHLDVRRHERLEDKDCEKLRQVLRYWHELRGGDDAANLR